MKLLTTKPCINTRSFFPQIIDYSRRFLASLALVALVFEQSLFIFASTAQAADLPINVDGSTNTQVTKTASGVDQVNIAAPNSAGLSHNKFSDYNVNQSGQIINNFSGQNQNEIVAGSGTSAVTSTQIGGLVTVNQNLASSGSAKVILNEVTSGNVSKLLGYTEIAGTKADLILANPNGIACSGCGFINTARLVMVGGRSNFDSAGNLGFNLKEQGDPNLYVPLVTIDGLGLDVSTTTSTEIIASSVKLLSTIYGADSNSLTIRTGDGKYDYATKNITPSNTSLTPTTPVFAIDASSLAKIQAGNIYLIATKSGVGVKMESEILASSTLNIDANGDVYYKNISVGNTATLKSTQTITTSDANSQINAPTLNITANQFDNLGTAAAYNLNIKNTTTLNNYNSLQALTLDLDKITNLNNYGNIVATKTLSITANSLTNSGATQSGETSIFNLNNLTNNQNSSIYSKSALNLNVAASLLNSGEISAQNDLTISGNSNITNSSKILSNSNLIIGATSLINNSSAVISSLTKSLNLTLSGNLQNIGNLNSTTALTLTTGSLSNSGNIFSNASLNITAVDFDNLAAASIFSTSAAIFTINGYLNNKGYIQSNGSLAVTISNKNNAANNNLTNAQNALIYSAANLTLTAAGYLDNSGEISTASSANLTFSQVTNSNKILANKSLTIDSTSITNKANATLASITEDLNFKISDFLDNSGTIFAAKNLALENLVLEKQIELNSITNSGEISFNKLANSNSEIKVKDFSNSGNFFSNSLNDDLTITSSNSFTNHGSASFGKNLTIKLSGTFDNYGAIGAVNNLTIASSSDVENSGSIVANNVVNISASNIKNGSSSKADAVISSINASTTLKAVNDINNYGEISSKTALSLNSENLFNYSKIISATTLSVDNSGLIKNTGNFQSAGATTLNSDSFNNSGKIYSTGNVTITNSEDLINSGSIYSEGNITTTSNNLENQNDAVLSAVQNFTATATNGVTNFGAISAIDSATFNAVTIVNSNSILANNSLTINAASITNNANANLASINQDLNFNITDFLDNSGTIFAKTNLVLGNKVELNYVTNHGKISFDKLANSKSELKVKDFSNFGSFISGSTVDDLVITSSNSFSNSDTISAVNNLTIQGNSSFENFGNILANNTLNISASSLTNGSTSKASAVISSLSGKVTLKASNDINNYGEISSKTALSLSAVNLFNYSKIISATTLDVDNSGLINNSGAFQSSSETTLTSTSLTNSGTIYSKNNVTIKNSGDLTNSKNIYAEGDVTTTSSNLENKSGAILSANQKLTVTTTNNVTNLGSIAASNNLNVTAIGVTNSNLIQSGNDATFTLTGDLTNNSNSTIYVGNDLTATSGTSSAIKNSGVISAINAATFTSKTFTNSSKILANSSLTVNSDSITNNQNATLASINQDLSFKVTDFLDNAGIIFAKTNLVLGDKIELNYVTNSGEISFNKLANLNAELKVKNFSNFGSFVSGSEIEDLVVTSSNIFSNSGTISAVNNLTIRGNSNFENFGNILANNTLNISALNINNGSSSKGGAVISSLSGKTTLKVSNDINNYGEISSKTALSLSAVNLFNYSKIISATILDVDNSGLINNSGAFQSASETTLTSTSLTNSGTIYSKSNIIIKNSGALTNSKNIYAEGDVTTTSSNLENKSGAILSANQKLTATTTNNITNSGSIAATTDLELTADNLTNSNLIQSGNDATFTLTADLTNNSNSTIYSGNNLTVKATGLGSKINNSGTVSVIGAAIFGSKTFVNSSSILANNSVTVNSNSITNNAEATLASINQDLNFNITDFLGNSGKIFAKTNLVLGDKIELNYVTNHGEISFNKLANSNSELKVKDFTNFGSFASGSTTDDLVITSSNSFSNSGTVSAVNNLTIRGNSDFENFGNILANNTLDISANNFTNGSTLKSGAVISSLNGKVTLSATDDINNYGEISSKTALSLSAVNLFNYSKIISATTLDVDNSGLINNSGTFQSSSETKLTATSLTNSGTIYSKNNVTITTSGDLTNSKNIYAEGEVTTTSNSLENKSGAILSANQKLTVTTTNEVTNSGTIAATTDLKVTAKNLTNSNSIQSGNDATFTLTADLTNNSNSTIYVGNDLTATSGTSSAINNFGVISAINTASLTAKTLVNSSSILANNSLTVKSNSITNNQNAILASINQDLNLNITDFLDNAGTIFAKTNLTLGSAKQLNSITNSGAISFNKLANSNAELKVTDFDNLGSFYAGSATDNLTIISSNSFTNSGTISVQGSFTINSTLLTSSVSLSNSGTINSAGSFTLYSKNLDNSGQISSLDSLTITDSSSITNSNKILSSGVLTITAQNLTSSADSITNLAIASLSNSLTLNITNQLTNSGQLSSSSDLIINANNFTNNKGANVLAGAQLKQTIGQSIINSGNFQSVGATTLKSNSLTNSGSIKSFGSSTIDIASITNQANAIIFSSSDADITANSELTNSGSILSNANLDVTSSSVTNNNQIYAVGNLTLNLSNSLNNNSAASLTALGALTISGTSAITNSSQIASNSNLAISATSLTNSSSLQSNGGITLDLTNLTNNSNSSIISAGSFTSTTAGTTSNSGTLQSGGTFTISAASLTNSSNALILANNLNITANNITNTGNVIATNYITLNATGNIDVSGSGNITNGNATGDNSNIKLVAGTYVSLTAKNNIENYTTIQGSTDTTLTATNGSVNNYSSGKIMGGSGTVTINVSNGAFNNNNTTDSNGNTTASSVVTANNNAIFNVKNLYNYGEISVANNLTTNVTNDLNNNKSAYIWSGNNAVFYVANNFINTSADIYANNNLTIQKNSAGDKTTSVQNISGDIETYAGDITIKAITLENKRSVDPSYWVYKPTRNGNPYYYTWNDGQYDLKFVNASLYNWQWLWDNWFGDGGREHQIQYIASSPINTDSIAANIVSGGKMTLAAASILNDVSNILSTSDLSITADSLTNQSKLYPEMIYMVTSDKHHEYSDNAADFGNNFSINDDYYVTALIKSGGSLSGSGFNTLKNITISPDYTKGTSAQFKSSTSSSSYVAGTSTIDGADQISKSTNVNKIDTYTLGQIGVINVDLSAITAAITSRSSVTKGSSYEVSSSSSDTSAGDKLTSKNVTKGSSSNLSATKSEIGSDSGSKDSVDSQEIVKSGSSNLSATKSQIDSDSGSKDSIDSQEIVKSGSSNLSATKSEIGSNSGSNSLDSEETVKSKSANLSATASQVDEDSGSSGGDDSGSKTITKKDAASDATTITSPANSDSTSNIIFSGSYKINLDPAATTPLVESRSQFTDTSKFFGSSYYFTALGLNGSAVLADIDRQTRITNTTASSTRMLGDSFVETKLILDQLKTLTNNSLFLSKSTTDANAQIKELLDNSVNQFAALGLNAEDVAQHGLTTAQANSLTKDIVTFEVTNVNGMQVLAPKIYLSLDTRNRLLGSDAALAGNSTISAMGDLTINAANANVTNSGSIIAGNNLTLNIGSLTSASIDSSSLASIAKIQAGNDLSIIANNPITLTSTPQLTSLSPVISPLQSGINLQNTLIKSGNTTSLAAIGDVTIANDKNLTLTTLSSSIPSLQTASLSSFSLSADSLRISSLNSSLLSSSIKDDAAAQRSALTFNSGSDIQITSSGSINIANNYTNTGGSIFMTAANNINNSNFTIKASDNVVMDANNINNIATANNANETKIEAGNIVSLNATKLACSGSDDGCSGGYKGGNITNIGATISGGNLVYLTADNNITNKALIQYNINGNTSYSSGLTNNQTAANFSNTTLDSTGISASDTNMLNSNANYIRSNLISQGNITSGGNLVLVAGNNLNNIGSNITADGSTYLEATNGNINITTAELRDRTVTSWGSKKKGGTSVSDNTTNLQSEISSGGTLELASGSDINITGSKLTTTDIGSNITLTAANDVNIAAAQDTKYSQTQTWKKGTTVSKSSTSGSSSITNVLSELTAQNGDISITSNADTNLIGVKLKSINLDVNAGNELNIYSVSDSSSSWASSTKSRGLSNVAGLGMVGFITANQLGLGDALVAKYVVGDKNSVQASSTATDKTSNISSVVEATGSVNLTSNQDLTISGSNISGASGSLISDQGSVNILAAQEVEKISASSSKTSRVNNSGSKGLKHTSGESIETVTNIASNLTFTDSLSLKTNGNSGAAQASDINIKGSNLTVSNGDLTLASSGNITIENAVDSVFKESSGSKRNETTKSFSTSIDYVETAASSSLSANNINISSSGDTTIQGSNVSTTGNLIIGSFTIAQNSDGSYQKDSNGNYVTTSGSTVDNLTIKNADLTEYHYAQNGKGYTGVAAAGMRVLPYVMLPVEVASDVVKKEMAILFPDALESLYMKYHPLGIGITLADNVKDKLGATRISTETESRTDKTTSYASNINVGGSMMTNSLNDTTIQGSNLNISGDLLANALGNFNIQAATNTEKNVSQESYETAGSFHSDLNVMRVNYRAGVTKDFVTQGSESDTTTLTSSNVNVGGSTLINTADQFNLIASNLITTGSTAIAANNNLNISDGKETQSASSYLDKLTIDTGVQVGNAYVDAAYAVVDAVKAQKAVKDAYDKLNKIEDLNNQGLASDKAVDRAQYQVVLALVNAGLSAAAAMQAVYGAGAAASTSLGTGFYGSAYVDITKLKATTSSEYAQSIASNLQSGDDISLTSGNGDVNIMGSNVSSTNGNLNLTAMLGNINITAGENTSSQDSKTSSRSLGGSVGTNGASANIGFSQSESSTDYTTYTNSTLKALNGSINLNSNADTTVYGANLLASDINLTVGGNLTVKSRQNLLESDSYAIGANLGLSGDSNGVSGVSAGFNTANGYQSRAWVDNLTSIIGTNSVTINTTNNTDVAGAMIANITNAATATNSSNYIDGGNLTLNTGSLTFSDLKNYNNSESNSMGLGLNLGFKANDPTAPQNSQSAQNTAGVVPGSLNISLSMQGSESSSTTKATIGNGTINIGGTAATTDQVAGLNRDITQTEQNKKTVITSDFETNLKIDTRLLAAGAASIAGSLGVEGADTVAQNNWDSYSGDTAKGAKLLGYGIAIPAVSVYAYATKSDLTASNALYTTAKNYNIIYNLAYNPNFKASDLVGEGKLISYDGVGVSDNINSKYANGFYDRENDTIAVNQRENETNSELAGTLAHEGVHRDFNINGQSYTNSEEIAAHLVGDFTESAWDSFQGSNTTLRASLPSVTLQSNNYANSVNFSNQNEINPYQKDVHKYLTRYLAENSGFTPEEARQVAAANYRVDTVIGKEPILSEDARELYHFTTKERLEDMKNLAYKTGDLSLFGEYLHALQDSYSHQKDGTPYDPTLGHAKFDLQTWVPTVRFDEIRTLDLLKALPAGEIFVSAFFRDSNATVTLPISSGLSNVASGDFGAYEDWTFARPELADEMAKNTYNEMQKFLSYKTSMVPAGIQQSINQVNQFTPISNPINKFNQILDNVQKFNRSPIINNPEAKGRILYE